MAAKKKEPLTYKREKNKVEISGDSADVKWLATLDLASSRLIWVAMLVIFLFIAPKASFLPFVWQWTRKYIFL